MPEAWRGQTLRGCWADWVPHRSEPEPIEPKARPPPDTVRGNVWYCRQEMHGTGDAWSIRSQYDISRSLPIVRPTLTIVLLLGTSIKPAVRVIHSDHNMENSSQSHSNSFIHRLNDANIRQLPKYFRIPSTEGSVVVFRFYGTNNKEGV